MSKVPNNLFLFICNKDLMGVPFKEPHLAVGYFIPQNDENVKPSAVNSLGRAYWNGLSSTKRQMTLKAAYVEMTENPKLKTFDEDQRAGIVWLVQNDVAPLNNGIPLQGRLVSFHGLDPRFEFPMVDVENHRPSLQDHLEQYRDDFWYIPISPLSTIKDETRAYRELTELAKIA